MRVNILRESEITGRLHHISGDQVHALFILFISPQFIIAITKLNYYLSKIKVLVVNIVED
jgi:hypothetical protein